MKDWNPIWMLALFIAVCFLAAGAGAVFTGSSVSTWYPTLRKPSWNPPAWIAEETFSPYRIVLARIAMVQFPDRRFQPRLPQMGGSPMA
jgi:hypothetical protein